MTADIPLIIEPADAQVLLDAAATDRPLLIVDLCSEIHYHQGHITGAVHVTPKSLMAGTPPAPGRLPELAQLTQIFSQIGYHPEQHILVYDDEGGGWAGRFIWTLDVIGHKYYSYINGGRTAWQDEGLPLTQESTAITASQPSLSIDRSPIAEIDDIVPQLQQPDFAVWDARSPAEYRGEKILAQKGGHIPGAINCEWTTLMDRQRGLRIRTDAKSHLQALGLTNKKQVITHCQSHHRSGFTYLVGKSLGFDIKAYHGSWSEWGNHPDTPVEQ